MADALIAAALAAAGLAGRVSVGSAGTGDWHLGERMDRRARAELARRGYDGSRHRARQISPDWLERVDLLIALDASNLPRLQRVAAGPPRPAGRVKAVPPFPPPAPAGLPGPRPD